MKRIVKVLLAVVILAAAAFLIYTGYFAVLRAEYPRQYQDYVTQYAAQDGVDPDLVYAVIKCESNFNPNARSGVGAQGLMQLTPDTMEWAQTKNGDKGSAADAFDPQTNIRLGTLVLSLHLKEFGDVRSALAAYHAGRGSVNGWLTDSSLSHDGKSLDSIPYADTNAYVSRVMAVYEQYQRLYADS